MTIFNAAPARPFETELPDLVDVLVVNAIEVETLGGGRVNSLESAAAAAAALSSRFKAVVVTVGGDGVAFCNQSGQRLSLLGIPVAVASPRGAGDAFVGTLAARVAMGDALNTALAAANKEAAQLVSTPERQRPLHVLLQKVDVTSQELR